MDGSNARVQLGLAPSASRHDVKKAYRRLAKQHHPDRGGNRQSFESLRRAAEAAMAASDPARPSHRYLEASRLALVEATRSVGPRNELDAMRRRRAQRSFAEELAAALSS